MRVPIATVTASCMLMLAGCSGSGGTTGTTAGTGAGGGTLPPVTTADAAVPARIDGFEVQKVPADQVPQPPTIAGEPAQEAALAIALGSSQDAYRIVAFRTAQDPGSVPEADRLAVVGEEGASVDAGSGHDVTLAGIPVRCYATDDFGDTSQPDSVCIYVDGPNLVFVVTQDQGPGGGEEFTRRVITARQSG